MNKYQDAMLYFINRIDENEIKNNQDRYAPNRDCLYELIHKEDEKEVIISESLPRCPNCNARVLYPTNKTRCSECGQKLDWSDTND